MIFYGGRESKLPASIMCTGSTTSKQGEIFLPNLTLPADPCPVIVEIFEGIGTYINFTVIDDWRECACTPERVNGEHDRKWRMRRSTSCERSHVARFDKDKFMSQAL
jgi:hypothetical protein